MPGALCLVQPPASPRRHRLPQARRPSRRPRRRNPRAAPGRPAKLASRSGNRYVTHSARVGSGELSLPGRKALRDVHTLEVVVSEAAALYACTLRSNSMSDSGFQGVAKPHPNSRSLQTLARQPLADEQKAHNRNLAKERALAEYAILKPKAFAFSGKPIAVAGAASRSGSTSSPPSTRRPLHPRLGRCAAFAEGLIYPRV